MFFETFQGPIKWFSDWPHHGTAQGPPNQICIPLKALTIATLFRPIKKAFSLISPSVITKEESYKSTRSVINNALYYPSYCLLLKRSKKFLATEQYIWPIQKKEEVMIKTVISPQKSTSSFWKLIEYLKLILNFYWIVGRDARIN